MAAREPQPLTRMLSEGEYISFIIVRNIFLKSRCERVIERESESVCVCVCVCVFIVNVVRFHSQRRSFCSVCVCVSVCVYVCVGNKHSVYDIIIIIIYNNNDNNNI